MRKGTTLGAHVSTPPPRSLNSGLRRQELARIKAENMVRSHANVAAHAYAHHPPLQALFGRLVKSKSMYDKDRILQSTAELEKAAARVSHFPELAQQRARTAVTRKRKPRRKKPANQKPRAKDAMATTTSMPQLQRRTRDASGEFIDLGGGAGAVEVDADSLTSDSDSDGQPGSTLPAAAGAQSSPKHTTAAGRQSKPKSKSKRSRKPRTGAPLSRTLRGPKGGRKRQGASRRRSRSSTQSRRKNRPGQRLPRSPDMSPITARTVLTPVRVRCGSSRQHRWVQWSHSTGRWFRFLRTPAQPSSTHLPLALPGSAATVGLGWTTRRPATGVALHRDVATLCGGGRHHPQTSSTC